MSDSHHRISVSSRESAGWSSQAMQPCTVIEPDYKAVYAVMVRRIAAADAYLVSGNSDQAKREIEKAMLVVESVEKPFVLLPTAL